MVAAGRLQRAAQARRGAAAAPEVHLRHHRAGEGHRDHPVAHPPLPVPAGAAGRAARRTSRTICEQEGVTVDRGALPLVVRAGRGSVRDSLSVLDQLIAGRRRRRASPTSSPPALLGYTDATLLDDVVDAFAAGDAAAVFRIVDQVVEAGHDPRRFAEDLLERLRDLVIIAAVPDAAGGDPRRPPGRRAGADAPAGRPLRRRRAVPGRRHRQRRPDRDARRHRAAAAARADLRPGAAARGRRRHPRRRGPAGPARAAGRHRRRTGRVGGSVPYAGGSVAVRRRRRPPAAAAPAAARTCSAARARRAEPRRPPRSRSPRQPPPAAEPPRRSPRRSPRPRRPSRRLAGAVDLVDRAAAVAEVLDRGRPAASG